MTKIFMYCVVGFIIIFILSIIWNFINVWLTWLLVIGIVFFIIKNIDKFIKKETKK